MNKKIIMPIALAMLMLTASFVMGAHLFQRASVDSDKLAMEFVADRWNLIPFWDTSWTHSSTDFQEKLPDEIKDRFHPEYYEELWERDMLVAYVYDFQENKYVKIIEKGVATTEHGIVDYDDVSRYPAMWVYFKKGADGKWIRDRWVEFDEEDMPEISEFTMNNGWNFVWFTPNVVGYKIGEIKGTCNYEKFAHWYVSSGSEPKDEGTWEIIEDVSQAENVKLSAMDVGKLMIIKVTEDCKLEVPEGEDITPPVLP